jgi:antigen flippase
MSGLPKPLTGESEPAVKRLLKEGRPYAYSTFATDIFERLDLLLILWIAGLQDQGYYAAMVPVVYPLTVIPNTMGLFLFNAAANQKRRLTTRDVHRILGSSIAVQTVCTIVFMLLIGTLIQWLYGPAFAPAVRFALWLAPVAAIKGILQGLDSYVKGRGKPLVAVRCRIVGIGLMILLTLALSPQYGAVAVAMSALAGQALCLVWLSGIVYADVRGSNAEESVE